MRDDVPRDMLRGTVCQAHQLLLDAAGVLLGMEQMSLEPEQGKDALVSTIAACCFLSNGEAMTPGARAACDNAHLSMLRRRESFSTPGGSCAHTSHPTQRSRRFEVVRRSMDGIRRFAAGGVGAAQNAPEFRGSF